MPTLPEPSFIERDPATVTAELIDLYEKMTGKALQPAQPERIFIDLVAYRESLLRIKIQQAAVKNLVRFSSGDMLEYLGELVDCPKLAAQPAKTTMRFTLTGIKDFDVVFDAGTKRGSKDGKVVFATDSQLTIPAGQISGDVAATADTAGIAGNGYLAGEINQEIDPLAYVQSAVNLAETADGAEIEDEDHYRDRITSAPESFSVAGPRGAYKALAKGAHPDIIDVAPISTDDAKVHLYLLCKNGAPSLAILDAVVAACSDEDNRPLSDKVLAESAIQVDFAIVVDVTLYDWCPDTSLTAKANIETLLSDYAATLRSKLGNDLVVKQLEAKVTAYPGVYKPVFSAPLVDRVLADNEWLNCTSITVDIVVERMRG